MIRGPRLPPFSKTENVSQEQLHFAGLDLRNVEHGVDQLEQVLAGRVDFIERSGRNSSKLLVSASSVNISL